MNYFEFLLLFIVLPLVFLLILNIVQKSKNSYSISPYLAMIILSVVALIYTTPWDNYLVAKTIWFYNETLVTGFTIGWVPIEEYSFFILQTILSGLLFFWIIEKTEFRELLEKKSKNLKNINMISVLAITVLWFSMILIFLLSLDPSLTYLSLILIWGLIPIGLQLLYGADIIWKHKRTVFSIIIILTSYLSIVDAIAIDRGIWTISPKTSTGILLGGILPIEEAVFFFITTILVIFGMILFLDKESILRAKKIIT